MNRQLAFTFGTDPLDAEKIASLPEPTPVPAVDFNHERHLKRLNRVRHIAGATLNVPDVTVENPAEYYQEDEPGLYCDICGFWLQPHLHEVHVSDALADLPNHQLCGDCLERHLDIDPFTIDEWYEQNPLAGWEKLPVETVLDSSETQRGQYHV